MIRPRGANRSAQNQEVQPVASDVRVRCVLGMAYCTAETFFTAEELLLSEISHRGVGVAESVHLAEKVREAGRPSLTNLLKSVLVESCRRERPARLRDGRVGIDRPSGLREPSDEFDPVDSAREALPDEDGGTGAENAADLVCGGSKVRDVVKDKGEPRGVCGFIWQRQGARISRTHLDGRCPRDLLPHRGRWLDCENAEIEPVAEGSGEHAGPCANVHQSHSLRRAEVTSYRLTPLRESVAGDLADRLERCSGLLVIADPGHLMPPCCRPPRCLQAPSSAAPVPSLAGLVTGAPADAVSSAPRTEQRRRHPGGSPP